MVVRLRTTRGSGRSRIGRPGSGRSAEAGTPRRHDRGRVRRLGGAGERGRGQLDDGRELDLRAHRAAGQGTPPDGGLPPTVHQSLGPGECLRRSPARRASGDRRSSGSPARASRACGPASSASRSSRARRGPSRAGGKAATASWIMGRTRVRTRRRNRTRSDGAMTDTGTPLARSERKRRRGSGGPVGK